MQPHEKHLAPMTRKQIFLNNFLAGIAWGVGSALGAAVLVFILGFALAKINVVPIIGSFFADIQQAIEQKQAPGPTPTPTGY